MPLQGLGKRRFALDPSCVLYLPLYELDGTLFRSKDAYGHLATVTGATWGIQGRTFDGDDYIALPTSGAHVTPTQGTLIFWFKPTVLDAVTAHTLLGYGGTEITSMGARLIKDTNYYLNWLGWISGNLSQIRGGTALSINTWYQAVIVSDGSTWSMYLNGVAETLTVMNGTNNGNWLGDDTHASPYFTLGTLRNSGAFIQSYKGVMGKFLAYNRALTAVEIQNIYLATKWRYS